MKKKMKSNPDKFSVRPSKKHKVKDSEKIHPNTDDPYEVTETPIKKMPVTDHPHHEEILDDIPK